MWATIDHLTGGRAGWNVVTSINRNQQAFEWFVSLLANIELQQKEIHEGHNVNPNDSQEEDNFIDMQV